MVETAAGESSPSPSSPVRGPAGIPRINDTAPDFTAPTTQGTIKFSQWQGDSWVVLFSHPADFTPVCTTELTEFARRSAEFAKRRTKLIGLSIDSVHSHLAWRENIREKLGAEIGYPLIADLSQDVAAKYGMVHPGASETATVRAVFVIDPKRKVRALVYYPMNVGRNVDEILRVVDALQTSDQHACATPVNWKPGEKVIVPPPKTEAEVAQRRSAPYEQIDFYLAMKDLPGS
jgi:peroxiredoxin (alkyl hydroperoxide reductase subunit C)